MKLTISTYEARSIVAVRHNVDIEEVHIEETAPRIAPEVVSNPELSLAALAENITIIARVMVDHKMQRVPYPNKILAIKAFRTLAAGCGLKDAKDVIEAMMTRV